ncbi:MAG: formylglycine-generating enzyme family protein [Treponema sp.]|nr:formylglycine-generating enzyme family protein [Treponema sp.]
MGGNVFEWRWDWYGDYGGGSQTDPADAVGGSYHVACGGSWGLDSLYGSSAGRYYNTRRSWSTGFRLARP